MKYIKAAQVLPRQLLEQIQEYVDGEYLYIPRVSGKKKHWGANTSTQKELLKRNQNIYREHLEGASVEDLADRYYLSVKSIQRILRQIKNEL